MTSQLRRRFRQRFTPSSHVIRKQILTVLCVSGVLTDQSRSAAPSSNRGEELFLTDSASAGSNPVHLSSRWNRHWWVEAIDLRRRAKPCAPASKLRNTPLSR